jgi:hypothetical protein
VSHEGGIQAKMRVENVAQHYDSLTWLPVGRDLPKRELVVNMYIISRTTSHGTERVGRWLNAEGSSVKSIFSSLELGRTPSCIITLTADQQDFILMLGSVLRWSYKWSNLDLKHPRSVQGSKGSCEIGSHMAASVAVEKRSWG